MSCSHQNPPHDSEQCWGHWLRLEPWGDKILHFGLPSTSFLRRCGKTIFAGQVFLKFKHLQWRKQGEIHIQALEELEWTDNWRPRLHQNSAKDRRWNKLILHGKFLFDRFYEYTWYPDDITPYSILKFAYLPWYVAAEFHNRCRLCCDDFDFMMGGTTFWKLVSGDTRISPKIDIEPQKLMVGRCLSFSFWIFEGLPLHTHNMSPKKGAFQKGKSSSNHTILREQSFVFRGLSAVCPPKWFWSKRETQRCFGNGKWNESDANFAHPWIPDRCFILLGFGIWVRLGHLFQNLHSTTIFNPEIGSLQTRRSETRGRRRSTGQDQRYSTLACKTLDPRPK